MTEVSKPFFQHRGGVPLNTTDDARNHAAALIDELLELEARTHPNEGDCSEKDELSRHATMIAGDLLEELIGWAIDHQIGLVLNGMPGGAAAPFDNSETDAIRRAGAHVHEATAAGYVVMETGIETDRKLLRSLLCAAPPSLFPAKLLVEVLPALDAIELGERPEFFAVKRGPGQERDTYQKWDLRFKAALHVEFLRGMNESRDNSLNKVANAYGCGTDAVQDWINQLPKKLQGILHVVEMKGRARHRGTVAREDLLTGDSSRAKKEAETLERNGARYQEIANLASADIVNLRV